jgi:L-lactate dehydrogenase complex protein LldE
MPRVQLFATCLIDTFYPETGESILTVLKRLGVSVDFPTAQTCCGQPLYNAGLQTDTVPLAKRTIGVFDELPGEVVVPSGSCALMLRSAYIGLFDSDPAWRARAKSLAKRTYEFTEYLVDFLGVTDLDAQWHGKLTYHPSCHLLRGLGIDRQPRQLLAAVKGAEIVELPQQEDCCGFGGIFSVNHPELSQAFLKRKIANLERSEASTMVVADSGCRMHIAGGLHRAGKKQQVVHIAEILAKN